MPNLKLSRLELYLKSSLTCSNYCGWRHGYGYSTAVVGVVAVWGVLARDVVDLQSPPVNALQVNYHSLSDLHVCVWEGAGGCTVRVGCGGAVGELSGVGARFSVLPCVNIAEI